MASRGSWLGAAVVLFVFAGAGCEVDRASPEPDPAGPDEQQGVEEPRWSPDPDLHVPVAPANPLPEPPLGPDGTLRAIWEYQSTNEIDFQGLTDEAGNLYWLERSPDGSAEVVSFDWDGLERWRSRITGKVPPRAEVIWYDDSRARIILVSGDHVLMTLGNQDGPTCAEDVHLLALRASDGTVAWRRNLGADLPPEPAFYLSCTARASQPAATDGALVVAVTRCTRIDDCRVSLDGFDVASGVRRFTHALAGATMSWSPIVDEAGNAYVLAGSGVQSVLLSVTSAGDVRMRSDLPYDAHGLAAVASGVLIHYAAQRGYSQHDASTGKDLLRLPADSKEWATPPFRISGTAILATPNAAYGALARWPLGSAVWDWAVWLPPGMFSPDAPPQYRAYYTTGTRELLLTSAGTLVFTRCAYDRCSLHEMDVDGYEHHRVPLPPGFGLTPPSLHHGRWVSGGTTGVRSFDLPGRMMATKGWLTEHGSLAGDRRAR